MLSNYHTPTTPQTGNFRRTTIEALLTLDGDTQTGDISLGRCTMAKLAHGQTEVDLTVPWLGGNVLADNSVSEVKPSYELTLTEFIPNLIPIMVFGDKGPDLVVTAVTGATVTFPSVYTGRTYRLNKRMVDTVVVKAGATTYVQDQDYQLLAALGLITIMPTGAIVDGSSITVTFNNPAYTLATITPYSRLNRSGMLRYYEIDARSANAKDEMIVPVSLIPTAYGDADSKKYSDMTLKCSFLGQPKKYARY